MKKKLINSIEKKEIEHKKYTFGIPIYDYMVDLYFIFNEKEKERFCNKNKLEYHPNRMATCYHEAPECIVIFSEIPIIQTITHEAAHMAFDIFGTCSIPVFDNLHNEAYCYLIGYIAEEISKKVVEYKNETLAT